MPVPLNITGILLFEFDSFEQWVAKAPSWYRPYKFQPTITLDKNSNVCHIGEDFMFARDNNLFPVSVYALKRSVFAHPFDSSPFSK